MKLVVVTVCLFLIALSLPAAADDVATCAGIEADTDRLACYDALFRDAVNVASADVTKPEADPEPPAEAEFGREQIERAKPIVERDEIAEINASVTDIKRRARNELIVYLSNGQVWAQVSPRYLTIKSGDGVVVRRGRMGGYILTTERGGSTRVKRLR